MEPLKLLIADDEEAVRHTLVSICESLGHEIVGQASNGQEAVRLASLSDPDLVLLDIRMPVMGGLDAARAILEKTSVPIVIVTGHTDRELITDAARLGVFSYLVKPITPERLLAAIATAQARFSDMQDLKGEVGDLRQSLDDRKLVERAKGVIMRDMKVGEQEAYRWLKRTSSQSNRKLADVARSIVALDTRRAGPS